MLRPQQGVMLGFSGGADSVALALLLREMSASGALPLRLRLAHLNHGLRGAESDGDEAFCRNLAVEWDLQLTVHRLPPSHLAAQGGSIEDAARRARMRFLSDVAIEQGFTTIVLGHHANDAAETVLMRLLRGCGIHGLATMRPVRPAGPEWPAGRVVRPLLSVDKDDIIAYLRRRAQPWREDSSNADLALARNRVRHLLLPAMLRARPGLSVRLLGDVNAAAAPVDDLLRQALASCWRDLCVREEAGEVLLDADALCRAPAALRTAVLRRAAGEPDREHSLALVALAAGPPGAALSLPGGVTARREHGLVRFARQRQSTGIRPAQLSMPGSVHIPDVGLTISAQALTVAPNAHAELLSRAGPWEVFLSPRLLDAPATVRSRRPGDRFHPLGAPGARKLKKFLIDRKAPFHERDRIPLVVASDGTIAWVPGYEVGESFRLTGSETQVVRLVASR